SSSLPPPPSPAPPLSLHAALPIFPLLWKPPLTRLNEDELDGMIALAEARGVPYHVDPTITPRDDGDASPLAYAPSAAGIDRLFQIGRAHVCTPVTDQPPLPSSPCQ